MANTIIICRLPDVLSQYKERFKKRILRSDDTRILVRNLTPSEITELSQDRQVTITKQVFYPPRKRPPHNI